VVSVLFTATPGLTVYLGGTEALRRDLEQ